MEPNVVLSPKIVQQLENSLNSSKPLQLFLPDHNHDYRSTNHVIRSIDIRSLAESGTVSQFLTNRKHSQLNYDITTILNKDWTILPQQRYAVAKCLCGSIIIDLEYARGLLVNTVEIYGRDPTVETRHERHDPTVSSKNKASIPSPHGTCTRIFGLSPCIKLKEIEPLRN